jgi:hypothetical protein
MRCKLLKTSVHAHKVKAWGNISARQRQKNRVYESNDNRPETSSLPLRRYNKKGKMKAWFILPFFRLYLNSCLIMILPFFNRFTGRPRLGRVSPACS